MASVLDKSSVRAKASAAMSAVALCTTTVFVLLGLSGCAEPLATGQGSGKADADWAAAQFDSEQGISDQKANTGAEATQGGDDSQNSTAAKKEGTDSLDPKAATQADDAQSHDTAKQQDSENAAAPSTSKPSTAALYAALGITEDYRSEFVHGEKPGKYQKYIVLHDTEGTSSAASVINYWDSNNNYVATHFIVNTDGSVYQAVPLDKIAHHVGFGDVGHNALYGVSDESRDDKRGTKPYSKSFPDYGMNSYSVGIEMVHVGGAGPYPEAQLKALDKLIAYIDAYYGFQSKIIAHNDWCSPNSDTSKEFAHYLANYKNHRSYQEK